MSARHRRKARSAPPTVDRAAATSIRTRGVEPRRLRWAAPALLAAILAVGAGFRIWLSLNDDGIFWPDEIYQSIEPAHRVVFGQGIMPWEFLLGARTWIFPGAIAAVLKILDLVGVRDPRAYIDLTRLLFSGVSVATAYASYRLARGYGASAVASAAGASVFALASLAIYLAPRALSENASALPAALGLALALPRGVSRRDRLVGSALVGLAVVLRLQNAVFAAGLLAVFAVRRRRGDFVAATAIFASWALLYGVVDQITWGRPFGSAQQYLAVNLATPELTSVFGSAAVTTLPQWYFPPPDYYVRSLLSSIPWPVIAGVALATLAARRAPDLSLIALAYLVVHSLIPHKELRYILPDLALLGALAAIGIDEASAIAGSRPWTSPALAGVLLVASAASAATFRQLTFRDLGVQGDRLVANAAEELRVSKTPDASAYDDPGPVNRLLLAARAMPDLCGIKVESVLPEFQGGYTYLHRSVPLYRLGGPPRSSPFFNYVIALRGTEAGADVRAAEGDVVLLRLRSSCQPDPAFDYRL